MTEPVEISGDESSVSLPPAVSDSDITLPDAVDSPCCKQDCLKQVISNPAAKAAAETLEASIVSATSADQKKSIVYACIEKNQALDKKNLVFHGVPVCMEAWCRCMQVKSHGRMRRLLVHVRQGHAPHPPDRRLHQEGNRHQEVAYTMDAFFQWAYNVMAEWLPDKPDDQRPHASRDFPELPQSGPPDIAWKDWDVAKGAAASAVEAFSVVRYLPYMTMTQLYDLSQSRGVNASKSTFDRVYKDNWAKSLKIRRQTEHGACNACTKLKLLRQTAHTPKELEAAQQAYKQHIEEMQLDRIVDARLCAMSRATFTSAVEPLHSVASLCYDAMDQAKFKVPRGSPTGGAVPKDIEKCWKPQLHLLGCILDGHVQGFFIADSNMANDANTTLTVISRACTLQVLSAHASCPCSCISDPTMAQGM